jgi:catechol-2,3-dioxygenase
MTTKSDPSTYIFNHTMFRIRDPKKSIEFYEKVLGMEVRPAATESDVHDWERRCSCPGKRQPDMT